MKFNQFRLLFFLSSVILLSSCLGTTTTVTTSSDPGFVSLTFAANDSIPFLSTAAFTLVDNTIVNVDSLPYKTRIDSVLPTFSFTSSAGSILYGGNRHKKDSALITGTDTIDFRTKLRIRNWATDAKTFKDYSIITNVHKVDPELYQWSKVSDNLNSIKATSQKAVILNDTLRYYLNDGTSAFSYTSINGTNWTNPTVSGLPTNTPLNDMMAFNGKLYLTQDGTNIYSSANGIRWTKKNVTAFTFKSLLYVLDSKLWAVVQSNTDLSFHFANSTDGDAWIVIGAIPANFPVRDFASTVYSSTTGLQKVLVLGGYSSTGSILNNSWSSEDKTGLYWIDFSTENHTLDTLAVGASVISYDSKLFVFGSRTDNGKSFYKVSKDEGLSWQIPDITRNIITSDYTVIPRSYQSAVVLRPKTYEKVNSVALKNEIEQSNRIFIIGGKNGALNYSDVYTGKLNRKNFLRQEKTLYVNK